MLNINTISLAIQEPSFSFSLQTFFSQSKINFDDKKYFPKDNKIEMRSYSIHECSNLFLDNELRGFLQHLVVDKELKARTILEHLKSINRIIDFLELTQNLVLSFLEKPLNRWTDSLQKYLLQKNKSLKIQKDTIGFLKRLYAFLQDSIGNIKEYDKPKWTLNNLPITLHETHSTTCLTIDFSQVYQTWAEKPIKAVTYFNLERQLALATVKHQLTAIFLFTSWLFDNTNVKSFTQVTPEILLKYKTCLHFTQPSTSTYNKRLVAISGFFSIGRLILPNDFPQVDFFLQPYFEKEPKHHIPGYSEAELKQIHKLYSHIPIQEARILFLLETCGMRISDILETPIYDEKGNYCLKQSNTQSWTFTYFIPKKQMYHSIIVHSLVKEVIHAAIETSQACYGSNCKFIFANNAVDCMNSRKLRNSIQKVATQLKLKADDGSPLKIHLHNFRRSFATKLINLDYEPSEIQKLLGQSCPTSLGHYITISDKKMNEKLQPIIQRNYELIEHIGHMDSLSLSKEDDMSFLPLSNGGCAKSPHESLCEHANRCYFCSMFHPQKEYLLVYQTQLEEAQRNIAICQREGFTIMLQYNQKLASKLEKIIQEVNTEDA